MEYFMLSRTGNREINEDFADVFSIDGKDVFVLADGLGGHGYGEIASREAAEAVRKCIVCSGGKNLEDILEDCFLMANLRLKKIQEEVGNETFFKSTMVILIVDNENMAWGHIGDSRLYHFEEQKIIERSMDHSVPQMLANAGKIREKQIRHHEDRSKLLRVLGAEEENSRPFISRAEPKISNSVYLLCSDGFWEFITEKNMEKTLRKSSHAEDWVRKMEKIVLKNGKNQKMDNYSAIAVVF